MNGKEIKVFHNELIKPLMLDGFWSKGVRKMLFDRHGSIRHFWEQSDELRDTFKTSWELSWKLMIDRALYRGIYFDHSQSFNLYMNLLHAKHIVSVLPTVNA